MVSNRYNVCICGGGNISHSLAAAFGRYANVGIFTRRPEEWSRKLEYRIADCSWTKTIGEIIVSDNPAMVNTAKVIIIALPRFAVEQELLMIEPHLHSGQAIVFIPAPPGLEKVIDKLGCRDVEVIGFQRVPFISRISQYGKSVCIGTVRSCSRVAFSDTKRISYWKDYFEKNIGGRVERLHSFSSFTFSNSNPLLHPSRLVELLRNNAYETCPLFYAEWGDMASRLYIAADKEMYEVYKVYDPESAKRDYESVLDHYCVNTEVDLTNKIRSIEAFKKILSPYRRYEDNLWRPDFDSRYFTEDIPYGTEIILDKASLVGIETPTIKYLVSEIERHISI